VYSYLSVEALKPYLNDTTNRADAEYRRALEAVSRQIDDWLDRTFQPYTATQYYTADDPNCLMVDDLLSVTSIKLDQAGTRTYATSMSTSDYELAPYNAAAKDQPYTIIETQPQAQYVFIDTPRGVQVVGNWGYWNRRTTLACTVSATTGISTASTSFTASAPGVIETGQTLLIDSEQVYVTGVSGSVVSIDRAQNGTTLATHSTGTTLQRYEYPSPIVEACRIQATRLYKRRDAPFGSFAGPTDLTENVVEVSRLDPDVEQLIMNYHRKSWLGV